MSILAFILSMSLITPATFAVGTSTLTVKSQLVGGGSTGGFYTVLFHNGKVVATGFTPAKFTVTDGVAYSVEVEGYQNFYFQYWKTSGSVNPTTNVKLSRSRSITAVICNGPPGTCPNPTPKNGITVYANRIAASYWAPCFALVCSAGTGPGASMYFALYNSAGKEIKTAFANEAGYTFTGLNPSAKYFVYPEDCDLCHGSTHDVLFQHWGSGSNTRPLEATVGTSLDAWYSCTNGCSGP